MLSNLEQTYNETQNVCFSVTTLEYYHSNNRQTLILGYVDPLGPTLGPPGAPFSTQGHKEGGIWQSPLSFHCYTHFISF